MSIISCNASAIWNIYIEDTKTDSGTRLVPMTDEVEACFRKIIQNRKTAKDQNL